MLVSVPSYAKSMISTSTYETKQDENVEPQQPRDI